MLPNYQLTYILTSCVPVIVEVGLYIFFSSHSFIMSFWTYFVSVSSLIFVAFASPDPLSNPDSSASWSALSANLGNGYSKNPVKRITSSVELGDASSAKCPYWMESMQQVGEATFNPDSKYEIFRNVKDFGAKGDGKTDDTTAIVRAIVTNIYDLAI